MFLFGLLVYDVVGGLPLWVEYVWLFYYYKNGVVQRDGRSRWNMGVLIRGQECNSQVSFSSYLVARALLRLTGFIYSKYRLPVGWTSQVWYLSGAVYITREMNSILDVRNHRQTQAERAVASRVMYLLTVLLFWTRVRERNRDRNCFGNILRSILSWGDFFPYLLKFAWAVWGAMKTLFS